VTILALIAASVIDERTFVVLKHAVGYGSGSVVVNHDPVASTSGAGRKIRPESDFHQDLIDPMGSRNVLNDRWIQPKQLYGSVFQRIMDGSFHEYHLNDILQEGGVSHYVRPVGKTMVFPHWTPWEKVVTAV